MKKRIVHTDGSTASIPLYTGKRKGALLQNLKKYRQLYIMLIPGIIHYIIFRYLPIGGLLMAFQDFDLYRGLLGSKFVGLANFVELFASNDLWLLIRNTLTLGILVLLWGLPVPIIFAIVLNEIRVVKFKKFVQTVSYIPSLISLVVVASMIKDFLSPSSGIVNTLLASLGFEKHYFMVDPKWYRTIYVISDVWKHFGYNAIIYFAAIGGIDTELYEAAEIDGCSRWRRIWHVTLPGLLPTICTMTILNAGKIFKIGADKTLLLYNPMTYDVADIFGTFVYRRGIMESDFSYAAAAGMFESIVAFILVMSTNTLSKRVSDNSLW